jgi:hypothetical protein
MGIRRRTVPACGTPSWRAGTWCCSSTRIDIECIASTSRELHLSRQQSKTDGQRLKQATLGAGKRLTVRIRASLPTLRTDHVQGVARGLHWPSTNFLSRRQNALLSLPPADINVQCRTGNGGLLMVSLKTTRRRLQATQTSQHARPWPCSVPTEKQTQAANTSALWSSVRVTGRCYGGVFRAVTQHASPHDTGLHEGSPRNGASRGHGHTERLALWDNGPQLALEEGRRGIEQRSKQVDIH